MYRLLCFVYFFVYDKRIVHQSVSHSCHVRPLYIIHVFCFSRKFLEASGIFGEKAGNKNLFTPARANSSCHISQSRGATR